MKEKIRDQKFQACSQFCIIVKDCVADSKIGVLPGCFSKQRHLGNLKELSEGVKLDRIGLYLPVHTLSEEWP